ncbi:MAG: CHAD domain-containing protein [Solirubrobacterales bacterium]|nr:CHAD domain-containing protein [Solirubrobacterales bacterium]
MKARKVKKLDPAGTLAENAARIVLVRVGELRAFAGDALDPDASATQHAMRIAAKRLRYVLEATGFCFGRAATSARRRTKDLQDLLGEIHDCDVMLPRVAEHRRALRRADADAVYERAGTDPDLDPKLAARAPHRTSYRGLDVLEVYLRARRKVLFDRFTELWHDSEERGVWRRLTAAADGEIARAAEMRRAAERAERARLALEEAERVRREAAEREQRAATELAEAEADVS